MKFAAAAVILVLSSPLAAAGPKTKVATKSKAAAKPAAAAPASTRAPEPAAGTSRLRHETIGIGPGYGSIEAGQAELARKDDDVAFTRSLAAGGAAASSTGGPFAAVEAAVARKKPTATGRVRVSFDVDRRGKVQRAIVVGFDRGVDKVIEGQLRATVLPREYVGQHVDTVLAFRQGKLLRH